MLKVHYQTDQEELLKACDGAMYSLFEDRIVKSAASETFTKEALREHAPDKDHFMLHLVAMGDTETYGPNKNGDAFFKAALEKYAHTFVDNGCFFREHRNRDQKTQGIGTVKAAAYNPDMRRVELIVHGSREKAAGEYEKAKEGKPLSFSMSCRVPYDRCNVCDHKAKKQADYCEHLKEGMLQYQPEFKKYAYAINDHPTFFDISVVAKPADRIAHYLDYAFPEEEQRLKAASTEAIITGSQWAEYEGVCVPDGANVWSAEKRATLQKLIEAEEMYEQLTKEAASSSPVSYFAWNIAPAASTEKISDEALESFREVETGELCKELAKRASILPFPEFAAYVNGVGRDEAINDPIIKYAAINKLPGIMQSLGETGPSGLDGIFDATSGNGASDTAEIQGHLDKVASQCDIRTAPTKHRVLSCVGEKRASTNTSAVDTSNFSDKDFAKAQALAEAYGIYKIAALVDITELHGNEVSEPQYILATAQNRFISY